MVMGSVLKERTGTGHSAAMTGERCADKTVIKHCLKTEVKGEMEER